MTRDKAAHSSTDEFVSSLPPEVTKRRRPWFAITVLVAFVVLIALAPTLFSLTSIGPQLVQSALKDRVDGTVTVQGVSLGWLSSVQVHGITLKDKQGEIFGTVKSIGLSKSLLGLITDANRLGTIAVEEPKIKLAVDRRGSNLEDFLAPLLKAPSSNAPTPECVVEVRGATVELVDVERQQAYTFAPIAARLASPTGAENTWQIGVDGKLGESAVFADIKYHVAPADGTAPYSVLIDSQNFPLEPLRSLATRGLGEVELKGQLSGKIAATFDAGFQPQALQFDKLDARRLVFAAPSLLGRDQIDVEQCLAEGSAQYNRGVWQLRDLQVKSDVAALAGTGDVRVSDFTTQNTLPQTDCQVRGLVDLARLGKMLPNTLRVREGVEIVQGQANVMLTSHAVGDGRRFEASLTTDGIQARRGAQVISLQEQVAVGGVVTQTASGWRIDKLDAKSSFLTADVTGSTENGQLNLRGDMQRLAEELAKFVDLSDVHLAGTLDAEVKWQTDAQQTIAASGEAKLARFQVEIPGMLPWSEDDLRVLIDAQGRRSSSNSARIESGKIEVRSGKDQLMVSLRQPMELVQWDHPLPTDLKLTGNLATWMPRLQAFLPTNGYRMSGPIDLEAQANVALSRVEVPQTTFKIKDFKIDGPGLHIQEPLVQGQSQFLWDSATGTASSANTTIQSTAMAIAAEKMQVQTIPATKLTGEMAVRGDLGKIMAWMNDPAVPAQLQYFGETQAELRFSYVDGVTKAQLSGNVAKMAVARRMPVVARNQLVRDVANASPWQTVWQEPNVVFGGEAGYDAAKDAITLNKMQTSVGTSVVSATGTIQKIATICQADLTGEIRYDLAPLAPLARPYLGDTFAIVGSASRPFELKGPLFETASGTTREAALFPAQLTGKAGLNWDSAQWMALEMGAGDLTAELKDSTMFVAPAKIPLSQGTVNLSPTVVLRGPKWYVSQEKTQLVDNVVITPQMCSQWIKYIAPLVADATQAQGKFSISLENAAVPIDAPAYCNAKGTFIIHNVTVGPGPLAQPLMNVARQVKSFMDGKTGVDSLVGWASNSLLPGFGGTGEAPAAAEPPVDTASATTKQWVDLPEQSVPIDVIDGRVHHQGLSMQIQDVIVRTSGSVGIADQTLQLTAEIPILDDWIKNRRELAGLKGQSIQIPITGTVTRPQLDTRGLLAFGKNLAFTAGRGALEGEFSRGMEKGTSAVQKGVGNIQNEVGKVQTKLQDEMTKGKAKLENELRDSFKGIFGS